MHRIDTEVDNFIIPPVLKPCCLIPSILLGQEVHGFVVKNGFHGDVFVCNALIMMYSEVERFNLFYKWACVVCELRKEREYSDDELLPCCM